MNGVYLSPAFCSANGIVLKAAGSKTASFGMLHPDDEVLKIRIEKTWPGFRCIFEPLDAGEFGLMLSRLYSEDGADEPPGRKAGTDEDQTAAIDRIAGDAPVINLLNSIFLEALAKHASDIHIESGKTDAAIRFRIDGMLVFIRNISRERSRAVSARLKLLSNLNVLETRRPQDGHIDITSENYSLDVRISVTPTIRGESVVLRLLNRSDNVFTLDSLGFSPGHRKIIAGLLGVPSGLVLVTGPTGSGKTTTLAAVLGELNTESTKIISIEDPVEYRVEGITQIQVNEELGLTFDAALRRIFRQDPDVIMVGEIRDAETAELAVRAALTGHLVFATLHTNDAPEAVFRLQNMGIPPYMASAVLRAVIAQRLIRRVCTACGAAGCDACSGTGYRGRTVIAEILAVTPDLAGRISSGIRPGELASLLAKKRHVTLFDDAAEKAAAGVTTAGEIRRELGEKV